MIAETETALLARLVEQGRGEGADLLTLRALAEEASEAGAARALERLGLADPSARADLDELRELLSAWRDAKRTARDAVVAWVVRIVLALVMLGMAVTGRDLAVRSLTDARLTSLIGPLDATQTAVLDAAGALLSASTAALGAAVKAVAPDTELSLLAYLPTVLDPRMPEAMRANMPVGWASPAFDRLQLEDYDWVQAGDAGASVRGAAFATERLGYPPERQDYFSGFVLNAADTPVFWPRIEAAATAGRAREPINFISRSLPIAVSSMPMRACAGWSRCRGRRPGRRSAVGASPERKLMATLVLTAVGTVVGGPIGGAIGAVIGNQIDRAIFTPKGAKGPRLDSLVVQGSSYGADLPRLFGTMRVSGSVIWATDLRESTHKSGGKGRPTTTTYSYSASFAVALSARSVRAIHRIWADGALLRGAAGDWKSDVGSFRLHTGDEGQAIDPLIAAAEGIDATPAHRGLAYAVFEDLQLADYGNRIPSLSFEVEADDGAVSLTTIAAILSDGEVSGMGGPLLGGYAASGDSLRGAIEGLGSALPVAFADGADGLHLVDETAAPLDLPVAELGAFASGAKPAPRVAIERQATGTLNEALSIGYYDPALDYQIGSQSARREVSARRAGAIDLPAAVDASNARSIVEARLAREWAARTTARLALPWRHLDVAAGAIVTVPGQGGRWRVTERAFEDMALTLTVQRLPAATGDAPPASSGSGLSQPDLLHGPTTLALLDLPSFGDDPATAPTLLIAAAGESAGWRKAALTLSLDDGASWQAIGGTAAPAIMGQAVTLLTSGSSAVRDDTNSVDILLLNDAMALAGSDGTGLSAGANLALLGEELIQFASAEQIGPRLFRLAGLLRGRRGSEWATGGHAIGDGFVLIDPDTLLAWPLPLSAIGRTVRVSASGVGDGESAETQLTFQARAMRPPAPVALHGTAMPDGSVSVGWTRRSRAGWNWLDDTDAPLAEEAERYQLLLSRSGGVTRSLTVTETVATIAPADLAAMGGTGPLIITIAQIGTTAASLPPATLTMTLGA